MTFNDIFEFIVLFGLGGSCFGLCFAVAISSLVKFCSKESGKKLEEDGWNRLLVVGFAFGAVFIYFTNYA